MSTILGALQNANYNLKNAKILLQVEMAKAQLHNAVTLLEKGYGLHEGVENILSDYDKVEDVPEKPEPWHEGVEEEKRLEKMLDL